MKHRRQYTVPSLITLEVSFPLVEAHSDTSTYVLNPLPAKVDIGFELLDSNSYLHPTDVK
jgi:hypothetical protein